MGKSPHAFAAEIHEDQTMTQSSRSTLMRRLAVGSAMAALLSGGWGWTDLLDGTAHAQPRFPVPADDNGWGPPHHWCPGQTPVPATGNHITDPLNWDWNVCHTYYFLWQGMGNVSNMIWDGDNPPPKPGPPVGLYCDPATLTNCRIGTHP
jgi:hypothetical protein